MAVSYPETAVRDDAPERGRESISRRAGYGSSRSGAHNLRRTSGRFWQRRHVREAEAKLLPIHPPTSPPELHPTPRGTTGLDPYYSDEVGAAVEADRLAEAVHCSRAVFVAAVALDHRAQHLTSWVWGICIRWNPRVIRFRSISSQPASRMCVPG